MNAPKQDEIVLVAYSVWYPARRAWMEQVRRFRSLRDAVRQVGRIPEWPFPAHLDGVFRAPVGAWTEITGEVERLAAEQKETEHDRTQDSE